MGKTPEGERFEHLVRAASGRVLATLIRQLRDIDTAEDALGDALALAAERWPVDGVPDAPDAWLLTVARRRAIDRIRRERQRDERERSAGRVHDRDDAVIIELAEERWRSGIDDDRLRLVFTCCHPALALEARIALTLRTVGGLSTAEIARAFLVPEATMAQRLSRAKRKIRLAGIPYRVPDGHELPDRLPGVLRVVYLIFNEGYLATRGADPIRVDLADRAIELGVLLGELMPDEPEVLGLLALMQVQHARRDARFDDHGDLVTTEHQDRGRWHRDEIDAAEARLEHALARRSPGSYQLQAAIAVLGATAPSFADTDWRQIAALYGELHRFEPTPIVQLNRAVAVSFGWDAAAGLALVDALAERGELSNHHLLHATRAELLVRTGDTAEALRSIARALDLAGNDAERRHLERRRDAIGGAGHPTSPGDGGG